MSLVQIDKLREELSEKIIPESIKLEGEIQNKLKVSMVDPEVSTEVLSKLKSLSILIQNKNSLLLSAKKYRKEFDQMLKSQENLFKALFDTRARICKEQPDSPLIQDYGKKIVETGILLKEIKTVDLILGYPKSKKKFKHWLNKNLTRYEEEFLGYFTDVYKAWGDIKEYAEDNL